MFVLAEKELLALTSERVLPLVDRCMDQASWTATSDQLAPGGRGTVGGKLLRSP